MAFAHGIAFSRSQFLAEHMDYISNMYAFKTAAIFPPRHPYIGTTTVVNDKAFDSFVHNYLTERCYGA